MRALLDARQAAPADDVQLIHMVRMALRDQFAGGVKWPEVGDKGYSESDYRTMADVAMGTESEDSARFVLAVLRRYPQTGPLLLTHVHHVSRYGAEASQAELVEFSKKTGGDAASQAQMIKEIHLGLQERGAPIGAPLRALAGEIAGQLIDGAKPSEQVVLGCDLISSMGFNGKEAGADRSHRASEGGRSLADRRRQCSRRD